MEFEMKLDALMEKANKHKEVLATEEAAKTALVMPFLQALGYDVFNPAEVVPEFTSDVGTKKGEKVDYAICIDDRVSMLIECKPISQDLSIKHASQLYRYFSVTAAKFAILTNGAKYKFYSDLDASNKMDDKPFYEFDLCKLKKSDYRNIAKFQRAGFDVDAIVETAASLQMEGAVLSALQQELSEPSDGMVRLIAAKVVDGRLTAATKASLKHHIVSAFNAIVRERLNERLTSAIDEGETNDPVIVDDFETSPDETEGFQIVRAIASEVVDVDRVHMRDSKSYCAILLDDNNRKPVVRLRFNSDTTRYVGTFAESNDEERHLITKNSDIYKLKQRIVARLKFLDTN